VLTSRVRLGALRPSKQKQVRRLEVEPHPANVAAINGCEATDRGPVQSSATGAVRRSPAPRGGHAPEKVAAIPGHSLGPTRNRLRSNGPARAGDRRLIKLGGVDAGARCR